MFVKTAACCEPLPYPRWPSFGNPGFWEGGEEPHILNPHHQNFLLANGICRGMHDLSKCTHLCGFLQASQNPFIPPMGVFWSRKPFRSSSPLSSCAFFQRFQILLDNMKLGIFQFLNIPTKLAVKLEEIGTQLSQTIATFSSPLWPKNFIKATAKASVMYNAFFLHICCWYPRRNLLKNWQSRPARKLSLRKHQGPIHLLMISISQFVLKHPCFHSLVVICLLLCHLLLQPHHHDNMSTKTALKRMAQPYEFDNQ